MADQRRCFVPYFKCVLCDGHFNQLRVQFWCYFLWDISVKGKATDKIIPEYTR